MDVCGRPLFANLVRCNRKASEEIQLLGTICKGEDQLLEDGRTTPSCNMCSNSWRAILSFSGESLLGRALTGGPVVMM